MSGDPMPPQHEPFADLLEDALHRSLARTAIRVITGDMIRTMAGLPLDPGSVVDRIEAEVRRDADEFIDRVRRSISGESAT